MAIELRLIRHAIAVGQHGNFARAAEALHLTQPSLSRSIAALEDTLGVPLFDRTPKGVTPTTFGRVLLERGETVLQREADLRREIALLAGLEIGSLVVSAAPYMNEVLIARAIGRIAAAHPNLRIDCRSVHPFEVVRQVIAGEADLGMANLFGLDRESRIAVEPLPSRRVYLACRPGHPLTRIADPSLAQALQFPLVTTRLRGEQAALAASRGLSERGAGSAEFRERMSAEMLPALRSFAPELLIISAGFDAHHLDPLGGLQLSDDDFAWITRELMAVAAASAQQRVVSVLEGGYSLEGLASGTAAHVRALMEA